MISLDGLKLVILEIVAESHNKQKHKINLIGRPDSPGDLEQRLGQSFDFETRRLAAKAFDELRSSAMLAPNYRDIADPENWVEITDKGRRALETGCLDPLDEQLRRINLHLVEIRRGAWAALQAETPDSLRQAAHSGRELLEQTLKEGAPDSEIRASPGYQPDKSSKNGITRKMRLRHVMRKFKDQVSESDVSVAESACDLVISIDDKLTAMAHARSKPTPDEIKDALTSAEIALRRILLPPNGACE